MNRRLLVSVLLLLVTAGMVWGAPQKRKSKSKNEKDYAHYVTVWGGAGYGSLYHNAPDWKALGGPGAEIGVGYEYDKKNFIFHTGLEMQYIMSISRLRNSFRENVDFLYTPLPDYTLAYHYDFTSFKDTEHALMLNLPILAGCRFAQDWFFTAGVRVGFGVFGQANANANVQVTFTDPVFAEDVDQGHYAGWYAVKDRMPLRLGLNIAPSAEIGRYLNKHMRLSIFGECNVLNMNHTATDQPLLDMAAMSRPDNIQVHSLFCSDKMADNKVHNFMVGARFTYLIALEKEKPAKKHTHTTSKPKPKTTPKPATKPTPASETTPAPEDTIRFGDMVVKKDEAVVLANLMFEFRTANIIQESTQQLQTLLDMMLTRPDIHIRIVGHTDNVGTDAFNDRLSLQRAEAVKQYLTDHGVAAGRITTEGRGSREPIDTNNTDEGRQHNRRVEFTVISQ